VELVAQNMNWLVFIEKCAMYGQSPAAKSQGIVVHCLRFHV